MRRASAFLPDNTIRKTAIILLIFRLQLGWSPVDSFNLLRAAAAADVSSLCRLNIRRCCGIPMAVPFHRATVLLDIQRAAARQHRATWSRVSPVAPRSRALFSVVLCQLCIFSLAA